MKRMWTIIGVADVPQSFEWYQSLLGLPKTAPAHDDFGQIVDSDGTVLLCLHAWGAHEHPSLTSPHDAKPGNGLLLFFRVDNVDVTLPRARALAGRLEEEPHVNPNTGTSEFRSGIPTDITSPSARSTRPDPPSRGDAATGAVPSSALDIQRGGAHIDAMTKTAVPSDPPKLVRDPRTGRAVEVYGLGALKGRLTLQKGIDLTKPIFEQVSKKGDGEASRVAKA